jgi:hypothetical protein
MLFRCLSGHFDLLQRMLLHFGEVWFQHKARFLVRNSARKDRFVWHFRSSIPVLGRDVALCTVSDLPARVVFVLGYQPSSTAAAYIEVCFVVRC